MTQRHTADTINDEALDQLYADRDQARQRAANAYGQRDRLRHRIAALAERWQLPGHIAMPDAAAEITDALDREKWAPEPDPIARVRALHSPATDWSWVTFGCQHGGTHTHLCRQCRTCHPCSTIRAIDGPAAAPPVANIPEPHRFNIQPPDPELERATTERVRRVLDEAQRATAQLAATDIPNTGLVVQRYRNDRGQDAWVFRCWGTHTCDGYLSLDHTSQQSAERARDRHVTEDHPREEQPDA